MQPLPDRVLATLPQMDAPLARDVAAQIGSDEPHVRAAFEALEASGRAKIVRRGNGLHLVPADYPGLICVVCKGEIERRSKYYAPKTCSYSCRMKMIWRTRDRNAQGDVLRATHKRHPEKMHVGIIRMLGTPGHKEHLKALSEKLWADPVNKMKRVVAMEAAWKGPQAEGRKEKARAQKRSFWSDPQKKEAARQKMLTGKRGRYQRAAIKLVGEGATDEEVALRTGRTIEQTKLLLRRLYRMGKINRAPSDGRKRKQTADVIANRVTKTVQLRAERRAAQ